RRRRRVELDLEGVRLRVDGRSPLREGGRGALDGADERVGRRLADRPHERRRRAAASREAVLALDRDLEGARLVGGGSEGARELDAGPGERREEEGQEVRLLHAWS